MTEATAERLLQGYSYGALQQMARQRGLVLADKTKAAMVHALAADLYRPARVAAALADLEPVERGLLERLILAGGTAPTEMVRTQLEQSGQVDPRRKSQYGSYEREKGSPWHRGSRSFPDVVARLGVLGLVFTSALAYGQTTADLTEAGAHLAIPRAILDQLPPAELAVESVAAPSRALLADGAVLLRDAYTFLTTCARAPLPLTNRGAIAKRALVPLDAALLVSERAGSARSEADLCRLSFLRAVLEQSSLLLARAGTLSAGDTVEEFLDLPAGERLARLYQAYREVQRWSELFHIESLTIRGSRGESPRMPVARGRVLAELAGLPGGKWVALSHLVERLRLQAYEFLLPREWVDPRSAYYGYHAYQPIPYERSTNALGLAFPGVTSETEGWGVVEAGFIRMMVCQPLYWLGMVDLGLEGEEVVSFRLTETGDCLLHGQAPVTEPGPVQVVVQPNFQIFAFPPTPEGVLFKLDQLAEQVRAEQAVEYRITRESVYRAQQAGKEAAWVTSWLEAVSAAPLPQNVRRTLEEWGAQHEQIVVRRAAPVLQADAEPTLDALYADPSLGPLLGRRLAPTLAMVPPEALSRLHQGLLDAGRLPALTEGPGEPGSHQLTVDEAGRITFRHRAPSLYVLRGIQGLATRDEVDGAWQLTPASLRAAARGGMTPEDVITVLERWHHGPFPPEVAAIVRRWVKDWGNGALGRMVLLQVESAETLSDLLADGEVGSFLRPVQGATTLAFVQDSAAEQVRASLEGRGMKLGPLPD